MALRNSWCFSRHLDLVFGWVLRSEDFPGPRPPVDASSPSTRCLVELNVVVVGVIRRFLLESFSHTFLCRSNACGLKVRLQMVHGRSVDWLSSGYSDGSSGAGPGPIAASTVSDAITGYQHARAMIPPPLAGGGAVPQATAAATCATAVVAVVVGAAAAAPVVVVVVLIVVNVGLQFVIHPPLMDLLMLVF